VAKNNCDMTAVEFGTQRDSRCRVGYWGLWDVWS